MLVGDDAFEYVVALEYIGYFTYAMRLLCELVLFSSAIYFLLAKLFLFFFVINWLQSLSFLFQISATLNDRTFFEYDKIHKLQDWEAKKTLELFFSAKMCVPSKRFSKPYSLLKGYSVYIEAACSENESPKFHAINCLQRLYLWFE